MKRIVLAAVMVFVSAFAGAQIQQNQPPQINVTGEGKVMVMPDQATISIGVENLGAEASEVKKKNDATVDAIIKYLKSIKLPESDYQTQRVNLNRNYDYTKKKYNYVASQTIVINLKDLSKYDAMMIGLVDAGVNTIHGVEFKTSKLVQYQTEARAKAVEDAKKKATDYTNALGQKAGKAILVTDNTQAYYPQNMMRAMKFDGAAEAANMQETLAVGEITVTANVNISFELQ